MLSSLSTIKVVAFSVAPSKAAAKRPPSPVDEDFEDDFALPDDSLTPLSLQPSSLAHRSSRRPSEIRRCHHSRLPTPTPHLALPTTPLHQPEHISEF
ncbi:hypothetical protein CERSUDRAFT_100953 [Gelatoporia subvermispora B]|uniref:Uncharacterized protein n=1 Tax=Ceriporiopsis subvermispora (strain B) TaxID=914234 RepID=M2QFN5_CERS8|nr:hypothetical protein CERSUDRAFT_100953 [Gelatoporia subvermispora B]